MFEETKNAKGKKENAKDLTEVEPNETGEDTIPEGSEEVNLTGNVQADPGINYDDLFKKGMEAKSSEFAQATGEYLKLSSLAIGVQMPYIYLGVTSFKDKKGETVTAAMLRDEEGKTFITAANIVVGALAQNAKEPPFFCKIVYKGKKPSKNNPGGFYDDAEILVL